jgi:acyl carrier protein
MTVHDRVQVIFQDVFDMPDLVWSEDIKPGDFPDWDSLNHINLIMSIEAEFGVQFLGEEIAAISGVGDIFTLLSRHGVDGIHVS